MKRFTAILLCAVLLFSFCACKKTNTTSTVTPNPTQNTNVTPVDGTIIGTWICEEIGNDYYFVFDESGNATVKWGSHSVQGEYDYDAEYDEYDIEIENFLYNIYKATFNGDTMLLMSDSASYIFERAESAMVTISAPDSLNVDSEIVGTWNCADTFERYVFNADSTAYYMDMEYLYRVDFRFDCVDGKLTFYSMGNSTNLEVNELEYKLEDGNLKIGDYTFTPDQT